jgi:hypothetical protein
MKFVSYNSEVAAVVQLSKYHIVIKRRFYDFINVS